MGIPKNLVKNIYSWLDLQRKGAERINQLASELEEHQKNVETSQVAGSSGRAIISSKSVKEAKETAEKINNLLKKIQELIETLTDEWERTPGQTASRGDSSEDDVVEKLLRSMAKDYGLHLNDNIKLSNILLDVNSEDIAVHLQTASVTGVSLLLLFLMNMVSKALLKKATKAAAAAGPATVADSAGTQATEMAAGHIGGGAVGLLFSVPELIINSVNLAEKKYVTEDITMMRENAAAIRESSEQMKKDLDDIRERLQKLSELKYSIGNPSRKSKGRRSLIAFAMKYCRDETTKRWLEDNSESKAFFKLVNMFYFLKRKIEQEEKKKKHSKNVDIIFLAHGSITDQMIPASRLLPLDYIEDVVLYSPWNCVLSADAAYDIATGTMEPQHRVFCCSSEDCRIPDGMHRPTELPDEWNSLKKARDKKIPNIMLGPVNPPEDGAWEAFEELKDEYGRPGRNRILIPFIIKGVKQYAVPFFVVSLALSLVLMFSRFQATLHLTACLGKGSERMKLDEEALKKQYAYTVDNTGMASSVDRSQRRDEELYTKFKAVFDQRSSGR